MANVVQIIINGVDNSVKAFATSKSGLIALEKAARTAAISFAALGAASVATGLLSFTKDAIDNADAMGKMAQKAGIAVEDFSRLAYSADLNEVSAEQLTKALKGLSEEMVKNGKGGDDVLKTLLATADEFANVGDGANKTSAAVERFKKQGQDLIPWLNKGSEAIREEMREADKFGKTISSEFARQADQFNDNLKIIKESFKGLASQITQQNMPAILGLSEVAKDAATEGTFLKRAMDALTTSALAQSPQLAVLITLLKKYGEESLEAAKKAATSNEGLFNPEHIQKAKELADKMTQMSLRGLAAIQGAERLAHKQRLKDINDFQISSEEKTRLRENSGSLLQQRLTEIHREGLDNRATLDHLYREGEVQAYIEWSQKYAAVEQASLEGRKQFLQAYEFFAQESNRAIFSYVAEGSRLVYDQLSSSIARVVTGQQKASEAAKQLGLSLAEAVVKWMAQRAIAFALEKSLAGAGAALNKAMMTTALASASALASANAVGAAAALIASYGSAAAAAGLLPGILISSAALGESLALAGGLGGIAHGGLSDVPAEQTYLLDKGERVLSPNQNTDLTEFLRGGRMTHVVINLDGRAIYEGMTEASRDGRLVIDAKAII
jgi:hypothetical protein